MNKPEKDNFRQAVYEIASLIPYGRATSYGAIAKAVGFPNMSRMVGNVMSKCDSNATKIPAHRVVNSQGMLSANTTFRNQGRMLEAEGIAIRNNKIQNWKEVFWDPLIEL